MTAEPTPTGGAPAGARRELVVVLVVLAGGAALLLLAAGRTWVRTAADPGRLEAARAQTGSALAPGLPALALVALAAVVAVLATRGRLRVAVGAVVLADGLGALALALTAPPSGAHASGWRWVAVGAAALVTLAGAAVGVRGRRWPTMGGRYDAPTGSAAATVGAAGPAAAGAGPDGADGAPPMPDRALWDAIERGDDPTA